MAKGLSPSFNRDALPRRWQVGETSITSTVAASFITVALFAGVIHAGDEFPVKKDGSGRGGEACRHRGHRRRGTMEGTSPFCTQEDEDIAKVGAAVFR